MKLRIWHIILAIALLLGAAFFYVQMKPRSLALVQAHSGPALDVVYATGFVEVENPAEVSARMTAPVTEVLVREGQKVSRGQILAVLDASEQKSTLVQLQAQRRNADAQSRRTAALFAKGWATAAARDQAVSTAQAARAAEAAAAARLAQFDVRATSSGEILRRDVEPGDLATPGKTLFIVGDPAALKITATVDERDVVRLAVGQEALLSSDAYPDKVIRARLRDITPSGDPNQRAFRARLSVLEAVALPVGLTFEVNIITRKVDQAVLVPSAAIVDGAVWRVVDGRARRVAVQTGIVGVDKSQILSGVRAGDWLVAKPPKDMQEGAAVRAAQTAPAPAAKAP